MVKKRDGKKECFDFLSFNAKAKRRAKDGKKCLTNCCTQIDTFTRRITETVECTKLLLYTVRHTNNPMHTKLRRRRSQRFGKKKRWDDASSVQSSREHNVCDRFMSSTNKNTRNKHIYDVNVSRGQIFSSSLCHAWFLN